MSISSIYNKYISANGITTDTRKIDEGSIFFALKGDNFNGNKFANEALKKGAAYAVIDEEQYQSTEQHILVSNVLETLQLLAKHHRSQLNIPIIGITGSNGKTTTKELINTVLKKKYNCFATKGNLNNHIGVPLSILSITKFHEIAVIEMGANHLGEIRDLCHIADPNHGIITNIGIAHIEGFGSFDGVKKTKKELYDYIENKNGVLFINSNDKVLNAIVPDLKRIAYGNNPNNNIQGIVNKMDPYINFEWKSGDYNSGIIKSKLIGEYNFENILAAIAIGNYFEVESDLINKAIEEYKPSNNRSQIEETEKNTIILDAYNANPTSMKAALDSFKAYEADHKYFILGDMLELGSESQTEHQKIVDLINKHDFKGILVGNHFNSLNQKVIESFENTEQAKSYLKKQNLKNHLILIKGSRGIKLETLQDIL